MKKRFFGVMLAASLAVSLTACGGKKTSQDNAASTVNKEVTAEELHPMQMFTSSM